MRHGALALALVLAGCLGSQEPGSSLVETSPPGNPEPAGTSPSPGVTESPPTTFAMAANECVGLTTGFAWTLDEPPEPAPTGWTTDTTIPEIFMWFFKCERVSWDLYERGPVEFLFEFHNMHVPPESCFGAGSGLEAPLHRLWIGDEDIARHASEVLGIPTTYADFNASIIFSDSLRQDEWRWKAPSHPESLLSSPSLVVPTTSGAVHDRNRFFWATGDHVSVFDMQGEFTGGGLALPLMGRMEEPTLYSMMGRQDYAEAGGTYTKADFVAPIVHYGDTLCGA